MTTQHGNRCGWTTVRANNGVAQVIPVPHPPHFIYEKLVDYQNIDIAFTFDGPIPLERLHRSLAHTLDEYPILAGRVALDRGALRMVPILGDLFSGFLCYLLPQRRIRCMNQGVHMLVRRGRGGIADVKGPVASSFCSQPRGLLVMLGCSAPLHITLTDFDDGCVLGVAASHAIVDGESLRQFLVDWSLAFQGDTVEGCMPDGDAPFGRVQPCDKFPDEFTQQTMLEAWGCDPTVREAAKELSWKRLPILLAFFVRVGIFCVFTIVMLIIWLFQPRNTTPRIELDFSSEDLRALKLAATDTEGGWVSTNEALLTHVYTLILDATLTPLHARSKCGVHIVVQLRGKDAGFPDRAVGNGVALVCFPVDLSAPDFQENARRVHINLRAELQPDRLKRYYELMRGASPVPLLSMGPIYMPRQHEGTFGVLHRWNRNPSFDAVHFGQRPRRVVPWNSGECCQVITTADGGAVVYVTKGRDGVRKWRIWWILECILFGFATQILKPEIRESLEWCCVCGVCAFAIVGLEYYGRCRSIFKRLELAHAKNKKERSIGPTASQVEMS